MARSNQEGVPDGMKRCSECEEVKVVGEFYKDRAQCKVCLSERCREYYQKNADKIIEYQREYNQKNADKIIERNREYRQKNADKISERKREYSQRPESKTLKHIRCIREKTGAKIYRSDIDDITFRAIHATYMIERELKNINKVAKNAKKPLDNPVHSADNSSNSIGGN